MHFTVIESHSGDQETILTGLYHNVTLTEKSCHFVTWRTGDCRTYSKNIFGAMAGPKHHGASGKFSPITTL